MGRTGFLNTKKKFLFNKILNIGPNEQSSSKITRKLFEKSSFQVNIITMSRSDTRQLKRAKVFVLSIHYSM